MNLLSRSSKSELVLPTYFQRACLQSTSGSRIFFISLELILGITLFKEESPDTASIVPIAFPLIAGAGTLTSILTLRAEYDLLNIIVAIIVNMIVVYIVLKSSGFLEKFLGNSGLNVLRKIFGVVLMAIAVKIFSANIQNLF